MQQTSRALKLCTAAAAPYGRSVAGGIGEIQTHIVIGLAVDLGGDLGEGGAAILLRRLHKCAEVPPVPVAEARL